MVAQYANEPDEQVGTKTAAAVIGVSEQYVRHSLDLVLRPDRDARGRRLYSLRAVRHYARLRAAAIATRQGK